MTIKDAIVETVYRSTGSTLFGRSVLQKKLYFVARLANEDFGFEQQFYGPYSAAVADALDALVHAGFVVEDGDASPEVTSRFGERRRFSYRLTLDGRETLHVRQVKRRVYGDVLGRIQEHWVAKNPDLLMIAAKVHQSLAAARRGEIDVPAVREALGQLEWELAGAEHEQIIGFLEHLGMVPKVEREPLSLAAVDVLKPWTPTAIPRSPAVRVAWVARGTTG